MEDKKNEESIDNKYIILEEKGKGGTGKVFRVKEIETGKIYAEKFFLKKAISSIKK